MISGIIASSGIAFGTSYIIEDSNLFKKKHIFKDNILNEIEKFMIGYKKTINDLKEIQDRANKIFKNNEEEIFEGQMLLLEDESFILEIKNFITNKLYTAETAIYEITNKRIKEIENIEDEYLKSRTIDIKDISNRLINNIYNKKIFFINEKNEKLILVSLDFYPSYMIQIDFNKISGLIIEKGNYTSHTSIIARSLNIPAIVGVNNATNLIKKDDYIVLDAINNLIHINPTSKDIQKLISISDTYAAEQKKLSELNFKDSVTLDNYKINLYANINTLYDLENIKKYSVDGVGLYRTEFLFMNRNDLPSEEEQFNKYKELTSYFPNSIITIRTIDIGGDKKVNCINLPKEENPYLGWRGIRISLKIKKILHDQLKAILRASAFGKIRIMYPMVSTYEEIEELKFELNLIKNNLYDNKILFDENIKIGIMIEVPSIVMILKHLLSDIDFFSIGTNDLTQYLLAADRGNELVSYLYNPLYPSMIIFIKQIIDIINKGNKELCLCGELSSNYNSIPLLIGLGLKSFSVNISSISKFKEVIRKVDLTNTKFMSDNILKQSKLDDVIKILNRFNK